MFVMVTSGRSACSIPIDRRRLERTGLLSPDASELADLSLVYFIDAE
jgi:hypothetical protein